MPKSSMVRSFIPPKAQSLNLDHLPALPWRSRVVLGILISGFFCFLAWIFEPDIAWPHFLAVVAGFTLGFAVSRVAPKNMSLAPPQNVLWYLQIKRKLAPVGQSRSDRLGFQFAGNMKKNAPSFPLTLLFQICQHIHSIAKLKRMILKRILGIRLPCNPTGVNVIWQNCRIHQCDTA